MSYILEALRKADAQRERDPSRGIHAQPLAPAASDAKGGPARTALWTGVAVGTAALAYAAWQFARPAEAPVAAAAPVPAPVSAPPAVVAAPAPAPVPALAPATTVMPPPPLVVVQAPPPIVVPPPAPAPMPAPVTAPAVAAPAAPAATEVRASPPPDAPKLAITGGVYSSNRAQRMLIVNGQVFNEGSELAPGVVLEQIRPNTAVLNFRGQRYSVNF